MRGAQLYWALSALLLFPIWQGCAAASRGRALVLIEDLARSSQFDQYLESVKRLGYEVERRSAADKDLRLRNWDDWLYDKLIILASGVQGMLPDLASVSSEILCLFGMQTEARPGQA